MAVISPRGRGSCIGYGTDIVDGAYRITLPVTDLIGSVGAVWDLVSAELLEASTYYPNGARETLLTTAEAAVEPMGFTGKEADEEIGVTYFGERWLISRVGRWASADPLEIHAMGGGETGNSYHYLAGAHLQGRDPVGLSCGDTMSCRGAATEANFSRPTGEAVQYQNGAPTSAPLTPRQIVGAAGADYHGRRAAAQERRQHRAERRAAAAERLREANQQAAMTFGASLIPGVGEVMDVATVLDPTQEPAIRLIALGSLAISAVSLGVAPNAGAALRGGEAIADAERAASRMVAGDGAPPRAGPTRGTQVPGDDPIVTVEPTTPEELFATGEGRSEIVAPGSSYAPRRPRDAAVNPTAPAANGGRSTIGTSPTQRAELNADIEIANGLGGEDIRVNQQQVNAGGNRVGVNRPDFGVTIDGRRFHIEYDRPPAPRARPHADRVGANDPNATTVLRELD